MSITDRIATAARRAFGNERPASASLAETKSRVDTKEYGSNSVSYAPSRDGTTSLVDSEYKYQLRGQQGGLMYRRMRWSDPHIWGLRQAQNLPMLQAQVHFEPADHKDKDALAKAEFAERLLLEDFPWRSFLQDSLLDIDYGFACFETVWRIENGEAKCRLALRPSSSIAVEDIHVRDGAIDHIVQRPLSGGEKTIPGEKLVWFAHQKEGDSFSGRSIMRPMYKPWSIKEELEIELAILVRKGGGVPDIETDEEPDAVTAAKLDEMGRRFGLTPDAFFRHTADTHVQLLAGNVNVKDVLEAIQQRNNEITSVCQAQVFDLGTTNSGSRALGSTLSELFNNGIQAEAKAREDVLNARGGLVHQLIAYNFPRDDNLPKLRFGNVQAVDLNKFAQALLWFSQAFGTLGPELQEWARSEAGMPEGTTEQVVVDAQKVPQTPAKVVPPQPPAGDGQPPVGGAQASEAHTHHGDGSQAQRTPSPETTGLQLAERRPPRGVEVYLDLAEITAQFDTAKTAIADATAPVREKLTVELVKRARTAQAKGNLASFAASSPPMVDALTADVAAVLEDFYAAGRNQVASELQRQKAGTPWTAQSIRAAEVGLAEGPSPEGLAAIKQQAEATARAIATQSQAAAAVQAARIGAGTPVGEVAMAAAVQREGAAAALRFVGIASDFMAMGRSEQMAAQAKEIEDYVYSALLDGATCSVCGPMDGEITTDADAAESWTPNPNCEGGSRCRCLTVAEVRQGASAPGKSPSTPEAPFDPAKLSDRESVEKWMNRRNNTLARECARISSVEAKANLAAATDEMLAGVAGVRAYGGEGYKAINAALRRGLSGEKLEAVIGREARPGLGGEAMWRFLDPNTIQFLKTDAEFGRLALAGMDHAMKRAVTHEDLLTTRVIGGRNALARQISGLWDSIEGSVIEDKSFVSTSLRRNWGVSQMESAKLKLTGRPIVLEIEVPKGSHGLLTDVIVTGKTTESTEAELLLPRGSRFRVISKEIGADGLRHLKVRLM